MLSTRSKDLHDMFNLTREYRDILQVYKMVYVNARRLRPQYRI